MADTKPAAPAVIKNEADDTGVVTVYCRLPHGVRLQVQREHEFQEQTPSGPRTAKIWVPDASYEPVIIEGNARGRGLDVAKTEHKQIVAGYAVTHNVPAKIWNRWLEQNKTMAIVVRRDVYAVKSQNDSAAVRSEADHKPTGLDPIDPTQVTSEFKSISRYIG